MRSTTLPVHPTLTHPRTGEPLVAVGVINGRAIWPVLGGSGEGDGGTSDSTTSTTSTTGDQTGTSGTDTGQAPDGTDAKAPKFEGEFDPERAQRLIANLRAERDEAKTAKTAAEQAQQERIDAIAKALGLAKDNDDPAKVAEELTAAKTTAETERDDARRELAIYRAAHEHNANPAKLADSRTFLGKLAALDLADDKFAEKVGGLIADAVKADPALAAGPTAPAKSGGPVTGRPDATTEPASLADAVHARMSGTG